MMKDKKKILREIGFNHSYGVWISDSDNKIRIKIAGKRGNGYFELTNRCNKFDFNDRVNFRRDESRDTIKYRLLTKLIDWV